MATWIESDRRSGFAPIYEHEIAHLEALGAAVRAARVAARLSRRDLAQWARIHPQTVARIEFGLRRTRGRTLRRMALGMAPRGEGERLYFQLAALAGPTLRPR